MNEKSGKIIVSACMMVRNEEANIERCLRSIQGIVDEIVIVDTGSEDKTVQIAESFGARVFHHPWEDDFSKHRNQSISYAKGKWIFIIDADEELIITKMNGDENPDRNALRNFLTMVSGQHGCAGVGVKDVQKGNVVMEFNSSRLFKNGTVHYDGIVHNAPVTTAKTSVLCEWMHIRHYGYDLTPEKKEAKFKRTNTLLRKRLEQDPEDYNCMFYLCQLNAESGRNNKEALIWGERYVQARDECLKKYGENHFNESIYFTLFRINLHLGNVQRAGELLQEAIKVFGGDLDIAIGIIEYGVATNNDEAKLEGVKGFLNTWERYEKDPTTKGNKFSYSHRPEGLSFALFHGALTHLLIGSKMFNGLVGLLDKLPPQVRQGYMSDFQNILNNAGTPLQVSFDKKPEENIVSANLTQEAFQ